MFGIKKAFSFQIKVLKYELKYKKKRQVKRFFFFSFFSVKLPSQTLGFKYYSHSHISMEKSWASESLG